MNKFRNIPKTCKQKHAHDSTKEAGYCDILMLRLRAKEFISYDSQVTYIIQEGFINSEGKKIRPITYTPDFVIYHDGVTEIIDVKGSSATKTQAWMLKWKMLQAKLREPRRYKFTIV